MYDSLQELEETRTQASKILKDFTTGEFNNKDTKMSYDPKRRAVSQTNMVFNELKEQEVFYDAIEEEPIYSNNKEPSASSFSSFPSKV